MTQITIEKTTEPTENEYPVISKEILNKCHELWNKLFEIQGILYLCNKSVENCFPDSTTTPNYDDISAISASFSHCVDALQDATGIIDLEIEVPLSNLNRAVIQN